MKAHVAGLLVAAWLTGCVVDVDLGRPPDEALGDMRAPSAPSPDVDPDPDTAIPDSAPPDLDPSPDAAPPPDSGPADLALPDADPGQIAECEDCVAALTDGLDCGEGACELDADLLDACALLCGAPDDGSCEGCFDALLPLLGACADFAPEAACRELEAALFARCEERCMDGPCPACLASISPDCAADSPLDCAERVVDDFGACFGVCDEQVVFEGMTCAVDAADGWTLCTHAVVERCDESLAADVDLCRTMALSDVAGCMDACRQLAEVRRQTCVELGFDDETCAERAFFEGEACMAVCQGIPWGICEPGGRARDALCAAAGGVSCTALGDQISLTCRGDFDIEGFCDGCLLGALGILEGCEPFDGCLGLLEDQWAFCLGDCGGLPPEPGCLRCALTGDRALGDCLADAEPPSDCHALRERAVDDCDDICGDAIPRAVPCSVRSTALFEDCVGAPDEATCFASAVVFDAACHWARLGVE